jgi:hypothetical protein
LKGVVLDKGPLDGVKLTVLGETFNRFDVPSCNGPYGYLTRGNRLVVYKDRAGAAQTLSATIFCSAKTQISSQNPQECPLIVDFDTNGFVVEGKLDRFDHLKPPLFEGVFVGDAGACMNRKSERIPRGFCRAAEHSS